MLYRLLVWILFHSIFLTGCAGSFESAASTRISKTNTFDMSPVSTMLPVTPSIGSISLPTMTIDPSLPPVSTTVPGFANTQTMFSRGMVHQQCLQVLSELPENKTYNGILISFGKLVFPEGKVSISDGYFDKVLFYNLENGKMQLSSQNKIINIAISADGTKYALQDQIDQQIKVFSADGQRLGTVLPGLDPWALGRWLDNERLVMVIVKPLEGNMNPFNIVFPQDVVVANPFTGEQERFPSNFPDIDHIRHNLAWDGSGTTAYDPTLTRVVYPAMIEKDYRGKAGAGYILWDIASQKKLLEISTNDFSRMPAWSPDGLQFIINHFGEGEFYIITRDGVVKQLTHLNAGLNSGSAKISYWSNWYRWSPDGRHLALWLETWDITNQKSQSITLAILDITTGEITDYCIPAGTSNLFEAYTPQWSPDGKMLATIINYQDGNFDTILVDFEQGIAAKIGENLTPKGWLNAIEE